jgi:hypothetical protein
MKSLMEVSLFQWSEVFKVSINLKEFFFYYVNSVNVLILMKLFFYKFELQGRILLGQC